MLDQSFIIYILQDILHCSRVNYSLLNRTQLRQNCLNFIHVKLETPKCQIQFTNSRQFINRFFALRDVHQKITSIHTSLSKETLLGLPFKRRKLFILIQQVYKTRQLARRALKINFNSAHADGDQRETVQSQNVNHSNSNF